MIFCALHEKPGKGEKSGRRNAGNGRNALSGALLVKKGLSKLVNGDAGSQPEALFSSLARETGFFAVKNRPAPSYTLPDAFENSTLFELSDVFSAVCHGESI